jgi:hypothetical protein
VTCQSCVCVDCIASCHIGSNCNTCNKLNGRTPDNLTLACAFCWMAWLQIAAEQIGVPSTGMLAIQTAGRCCSSASWAFGVSRVCAL